MVTQVELRQNVGSFVESMKALPNGACRFANRGVEMGMGDWRDATENNSASFHIDLPPLLKCCLLFCLRHGSTCGRFWTLGKDVKGSISAFYVCPVSFCLKDLRDESFPLGKICRAFEQGNVVQFYCGHDACGLHVK